LPGSGVRFGADTAARNPTSGFSEPEVVLREQILVSGQPEVGHGPKYGENHRPEGGSGQTGSRNMAATRFLDSATPTSYSTLNTLWGLTRTVTELPGGNLSIRIFSEIRPNFSRILTKRFRSNFLSP